MISDSLGQKHHCRRPTWIFDVMVVVRLSLRTSQLVVNHHSIIMAVFFSVFWDLYCAAPERRDLNEHSSEAKAFHDYVSSSDKIACRCSHLFITLRLLQGFVNSGYHNTINGIHVSTHTRFMSFKKPPFTIYMSFPSIDV